MNTLDHVNISTTEQSVAEKLKSEFSHLGYYFRKNRSKERGKEGKFNLILVNNEHINIDTKSFAGILLLSQHRRELCFITTENTRILRNAAYIFANDTWSRRDNVSGPDSRTIYVNFDNKSTITNLASCLRNHDNNINVPCQILSAKDVLAGTETTSEFISKLLTLRQ